MIKRFAVSILLVSLFLSACTTSPQVMEKDSAEEMTEKTDGGMKDLSTSDTMEEDSNETMNDSSEDMNEDSDQDMMDESKDEMKEEPDEDMTSETEWFGITFTNVKTGGNFTINDFKGKVVLVETLAMWCSNCMKQQQQVKLLHESLGMNEDLISIGLDVDTNEKAEDLKTYVTNNGFDWIYAVANEEVTREIANLYGAQFLNPTSTPILIIDRKGQAHPMPFGIKSSEDLKNFIEPFLSENM